MLCWHKAGPARVGSAATAPVDRDAKTVELSEAAPETPEEVTGALTSPDRTTLLIVTSSGWFRADVEGGGEPQLAFEELVDPQGRIVNAAGVSVLDPNDGEWIAGGVGARTPAFASPVPRSAAAEPDIGG
jgi:hypothetical protein